MPQATPTTYALLGLLALRPWTAYELTGQARRSMRFIWPRSEAHLYAETKRLLVLGYARAERKGTGRRFRAEYSITPAGRDALRAWLATPPAAPVLEVEGLLRMLHADHGTRDDLLAALESTRRSADGLLAQGIDQARGYLADGGPFPERLHIIALLADFDSRFLELLVDWCERAADEVRGWPSTHGVGLTDAARSHLEALLERSAEREARRSGDAADDEDAREATARTARATPPPRAARRERGPRTR